MTTLCATEIYAQDQQAYTILVSGVKTSDDYEKLLAVMTTTDSDIATVVPRTVVPNSSGVVNFIITAVAPGTCNINITVHGDNYTQSSTIINVTVVAKEDGTLGVVVSPAGSANITVTPLNRSLPNSGSNYSFGVLFDKYLSKKSRY